jgi:hypothetical protein
LCDNFSIVDLAQAVRLSNGKLPLEASGNIDENTILAVARIYDYYPRFGPCCEWDTAAGACILQNAGGSVLDENGLWIW